LQKRSRETHRALLAAAERVFEARGYDDTQTPEIAKEAGVAVGTFYRYFDDKREIFLEMILGHLDRTYERVMSNLSPEVFASSHSATERRAIIERVVELLFQVADERPELHRLLLSVALRDEGVAALRQEFEERSRGALSQLIRLVVPADRIADPEAAAEVIQIAAMEVAFIASSYRATRAGRIAAKARRQALTDMLYRYVFGDE